MAELHTDIRFVKGIGEKRAQLLGKLGITTLQDLICHYPRSYEDRSNFRDIASLTPEETVCIKAFVTVAPTLTRMRNGKPCVSLTISDETGSLQVTFFNNPYVKQQIFLGNEYHFYGKIYQSTYHLSMINPAFEARHKAGIITGRIVPVYPSATGISQTFLMTVIQSSLTALNGNYPNILPDAVCKRHALVPVDEAFQNIHAPESIEKLNAARKRLIFEELFVLACGLGLLKERRTYVNGVAFQTVDWDVFYRTLPFTPTNAQKRAIHEATSDMCTGRPMNRLIQGDVGSGKTLIAAACIWFAFQNGKQSAFMAPTEILAKQHFATLSELLAPFHIPLTLLTGSMTEKQKRHCKEDIVLGTASAVIGTHALLSSGVDFHDLALVIVDEQHRFGVRQRSALLEKGSTPHILVMSATPIPRTLALILYGDLDVSILDELPPGRQTVDTFLVDDSMRNRIYRFILRLVTEGRQVFIVCPRVEEDENENADTIKSAEAYASELQTSIFPQLRISCIHGKMHAKQKDAIMHDFLAGEIHILVATTVIEVGVDVPNSALMIIENAERFGLSQLHQLRGRVGRGIHKSYCVLFSNTKNQDTKKRLQVMCETSDGFRIADADLKLRGPGDFFGARQHGLPEMHMADLCNDIELLQIAQQEAKTLLKTDPYLQHEENKPLLQRLKVLFHLYGETFN